MVLGERRTRVLTMAVHARAQGTGTKRSWVAPL